MILAKLPSDISTQATILGGGAIAPISAGSSSGTEILAAVINTAGSWTRVGGTTFTDAVAKPNDEDTSYVTIAAGIDTAILYDIQDSALSGATIVSVTVRMRGRVTVGSDTVTIQMATDGTFVTNIANNGSITSAYADNVGCTSTTKPGGGAWTVAQVNALQVKVFGIDLAIIRMTTLTVEVAWTIP